MNHVVRWSADAEHDPEAIADYIAENDAPERAHSVIDKILDAAGSLTTHPDKDNYPKELEAFGKREYRQIFLKPDRLILQVVGRYLTVMLVADGRRDLPTLLAKRLLDRI
jgi:toxin ParE1/3/4